MKSNKRKSNKNSFYNFDRVVNISPTNFTENNSRRESGHVEVLPKLHIYKVQPRNEMRPYADPERGHGPLLLTKTDVNRLEREKMDACDKDDVDKFKECLEEKLQKIEEMDKCRKTWQKVQDEKECGEGPNDLVCEDQRRANLLKENYCLNKLEREDEIKYMRTMLKNTVSTAVWKQQMEEKRQVEQAWKREDARLDALTAQLDKQKTGEAREWHARRKMELMEGLVAQINEKKLRALEEEELKYYEGQKMRECWARNNERELKEMKENGKCNSEYRKELDACLLDKNFHKLKHEEMERRLMKKNEEILKELEQKEMLYKKNVQWKIDGQQKVADMMRKRQEEALKTATEAEERRILRAMNQLERDKRNRERMEACLKKDDEIKLRQARAKQLSFKREAMAMQAAKDRLYFESDLRKLIREIEKDEGEEGEKWKRKEYGQMLKQQICEEAEAKKKAMCDRYKERVCNEQKERHRREILISHAKEALSKHKCILPAQQLLRISEKVEHVTNNPN